MQRVTNLAQTDYIINERAARAPTEITYGFLNATSAHSPPIQVSTGHNSLTNGAERAIVAMCEPNNQH